MGTMELTLVLEMGICCRKESVTLAGLAGGG